MDTPLEQPQKKDNLLKGCFLQLEHNLGKKAKKVECFYEWDLLDPKEDINNLTIPISVLPVLKKSHSEWENSLFFNDIFFCYPEEELLPYYGENILETEKESMEEKKGIFCLYGREGTGKKSAVRHYEKKQKFRF